MSIGTAALLSGLVSAALFSAAWWTTNTILFVFGLVALAGGVFWVMHSASGLNRRMTRFAEQAAGGKAVSEQDVPLEFKELNKAVDAMRQAGMYSDSVLQAVGNPVVATDEKGIIRLANKAAVDLIKKPLDRILGETVGMAVYNKNDASVSEKVLAQKQGFVATATLNFWDGRSVPATVAADVVKDEAGAIIGAVASFVDLSELEEEKSKLTQHQQEMASIGSNVSDLAQRVASAAEELSASADEQAKGAVQQKGQTDTVATAMEQMTATVLEVAHNASETSQAAEEADQSANHGVEMVTQAVQGIEKVTDSARRLSEGLGQLNHEADEIGRIINVINDIADQTNLLALNAAIEAARAGDAGRGFAVVADEVRKLAEKTMIATKDVEDGVGKIQNRTQQAVTAMQETEEQVAESTELSNQAGQALEEIMSRIQDMVQRVTQIATAAEEQSSAAEAINQNIEDIALIAREADEGAGQTAAATRDLAELAQELLTVAMGFSGRQGSESLLRASSGNMKGVLPKMMQGYVQQQFGDAVYASMQQEMGEPVFLPTSSYPDAVIHQMAECVEAATGTSKREILFNLGKYTIPMFHKMYKRYFKEGRTLKDFYLSIDEVHRTLTKDDPSLSPPKFTYEDKGDVLFMNYKSGRGLFDYFEGILLSAADFLGERVEVTITPLDDETARAAIRFL